MCRRAEVATALRMRNPTLVKPRFATVAVTSNRSDSMNPTDPGFMKIDGDTLMISLGRCAPQRQTPSPRCWSLCCKAATVRPIRGDESRESKSCPCHQFRTNSRKHRSPCLETASPLTEKGTGLLESPNALRIARPRQAPAQFMTLSTAKWLKL
jgi:hypothetical protein